MVAVKQSLRHKMWTEITRRKYEREGPRYASDLTDAEWALIEPYMPPAKRLGRPRDTELRSVLDAILYIARTGCQWRMLPKDFPPFTTRWPKLAALMDDSEHDVLAYMTFPAQHRTKLHST